MTIWEVFERSRSFFPHKDALVFVNSGGEQTAVSYREIRYGVKSLTGVLVERSIEKGSRVCLSLPNSPHFVSTYLALSRIGAISVLLNPALPQERIEKIRKDTAASLLINEEELGKLRYEAHSETASLNSEHQCSLEAGDTASILYSSGTTGEQKGVELTHSNIYNNIKYTSVLTGMTPEDRLICFLPLTHCFGLNFILGASLYTGATLVLHEKFDLQQVLDSLVRNRVTMFFAVPAIYNMMLKQKIDPFYFASVRYFFYAADMMPYDKILEWEAKYGRKIYTGWGLTETSPFATSNHSAIYKLGEQEWKVPSVGKAIPGVEIDVVDENGNHLRMKKGYAPRDYRPFCGEVRVKGHNVMKGYWRRPKETADVIDENGWFRTGDIGFQDSDGYLYIVDRKKDMINVGGEKAWPAEIEKIIIQHEHVADVGVVGVPHPEIGEVPKAFIVAKDPALTKEEIQEFIRPKLMKHEFLREIEFIDKLPRNPSGKILRRELRGK